MFDHLLTASELLFKPQVLGVIVMAGAYGLFVGSIPGLTATMATALLIPVTFFMDPIPSIGAIVTMEAMAIFAGDIPGALLRIPGTPSSAAYVEESYNLTRKGQAELVLGVDLADAVIGGLFGSIVLILMAPALAEVAIRFTSFEFFWLAVIGLSTSVMVSRGSLTKAMVSLLIGLFIATIGLDITMGYPRFNFGSTELMGGVGFIPAMIGMFGVSEVLRNVTSGQLGFTQAVNRLGSLFKGIGRTLNQYKLNVLRGSVLGTAIGILPGAGADIAAWVSYGLGKRMSKTPELYGTGHIEGIVGAGSANNAALGGAWIPALVFGIPGDSITAIVIGVLYMKGLQPGPLLFKRSPEMLYAVYETFILANILLLPMGYLAIKFSSRILAVPRNVLMPVILLFCIVGSFAINNTPFDVGVMLATGILAFVMEENDFPIAPAILGIVLGPLLEDSFVVSMIKSQWNPAGFFLRPVAMILGLIAVGLWVSPFLYRFKDLLNNRRKPEDVP